MRTKTYDRSDLQRLAEKAPNDIVAAAILSGRLDSIGDGDTIYTRPGVSAKHLPANVTRSLSSDAGRESPAPRAAAIPAFAPATIPAAAPTPDPSPRAGSVDEVRAANAKLLSDFWHAVADDGPTVDRSDPVAERDEAVQRAHARVEAERAKANPTKVDEAIAAFNEL